MNEKRLHRERRLKGDTVFEGQRFKVRVDTVSLADGRQATREVVENRQASVVAPIDEGGNVLLVRQFRYAVGAEVLEAPAGVTEGDETPEECALRELQEETGYSSRDLRGLGRIWSSPGFCTEVIHVFVARDLEPSSLSPDPDEDIRLERVALSGVGAMVRDGEIRDAKTIAALLMVTCLPE